MYTALFFWLICLVLSGIFLEGGEKVILNYLAVSVCFWIGSYFFALWLPNPPWFVVALIALCPPLLFLATIAITLKIFR